MRQTREPITPQAVLFDGETKNNLFNKNDSFEQIDNDDNISNLDGDFIDPVTVYRF